MTEAILLLSVTNVIISVIAVWQRHQSASLAREKRLRRLEKARKKRREAA